MIIKMLLLLISIIQSIMCDTQLCNLITHTFVIGVYCDAPSCAQHFGDALFQDFCEHIFTVEQAIDIVKKYEIGGIIFLGKSTYDAQKEAMNRINEASRVSLLYLQDFECGLGMRIIDSARCPFACELEQENLETIESYAATIGHEMRQLGVHINLAPVCDVRYHENPITRLRSFSENPDVVSSHAIAFMNGLQKNRVAACAKHFPGHGPTTADSHYYLPLITKSIRELELNDLKPFRQLIAHNVHFIMTGHLLIPDGDEIYPVSLSRFWVHDYLRVHLEYQGIIITDALNMKSLDKWPTGEKELLALKAGNDMLLCPHKDLESVVTYIEQDLKNDINLLEEVYKKCERISALAPLFNEKFI